MVSLGNNIAAGNWSAAGMDTIGVIADTAALAIPVVPGGASIAIKAGDGAKSKASTNRNPNKLAPVEDAAGPHTSFRRGPDGKISNYETHDKNPHTGEWGAAERFRGEGKEHGGVEPPLILDRPAGKGPGSRPNVPRKPEASELPKGY